MKTSFLTTPAILALAMAGCALPPVKLTTPEPVKVDIQVRLDVYQHGQKEKQAEEKTTSEGGQDETASIEARRRNRMGDIQLFKNSRIVGENRHGLLEIRTLPPGEYGEYVKSVVEAENADRDLLMRKQAAEQGTSLAAIQSERARLWRSQAFQGEWIEEPVAGESGYQWVQKGKAL